MFKKANVKPTKHSRLCSLRENLFRLQSGPEKVVTLGYPGAKISHAWCAHIRPINGRYVDATNP